LRWIAGVAASIALLLTAYIFIPKTNKESVIVQETELTEEEKAEALRAYKQTKAALFFVSTKMNEGTQKAAEGMNKVKNLDKVLQEFE
jgi:flagellar biosynthesis protein FliP